MKFSLIIQNKIDISIFKYQKLRRIILPIILFLSVFSGVISIHAQDEDETGEAIALFNRGQDAHEKGDFPAALKFYDEAVKIIPEFPEAQYQRGTALLSLGNHAEAEKAFRRALELREDWTLPMTQLGALLVRKNEFAEAEKLLSQAVESDENNSAAFAALTELRLKTKAAPEVIAELLKKIRVLSSKANPTALIWATRAALERHSGDTKSAKQSIKNALAIEPENISALAVRIEIAIAEGDFTRAVEDAKFLVSKDSGSLCGENFCLPACMPPPEIPPKQIRFWIRSIRLTETLSN